MSKRDLNLHALKIDTIVQEKTQFRSALGQYSDLTSTHFHDQEQLVNKFMTDWERFESASDRVIQTIDDGDIALARAQDEFAESEKELIATIDAAIITAEGGVSSEEIMFTSSLNNANYSIIVIIFTSVTITFAIVVLVIFSLSRPLATLRQTIHEISKGNFDVEVKLQQDDEMRALVADFEKMKGDLKEKDRLKEEFINIAAHELRTPVLPIILTSEDLVDEIDADKSDKVKVILRNAKRLKKLTDGILDASRIESNTFKLNKSGTNLVNLVQDIVHDAHSRILPNQNVKIIFEPKLSEKYEILLDREKIQQVIINLVNNAIDVTDSGTITLLLQENDASANSVEIKVIDTGKGIDESIKDKLFQKFVTKSNKVKGTGLGLYISKAIVEAHGGKIYAVNNIDGKGSTFAFTLPVNQISSYRFEKFSPSANTATYASK